MINENEEKIDLVNLLHDWLMIVRRLWWVALAMIVVLSGLLALRAKLTYFPIYEADMTFTIYVGDPMQSEMQGYNVNTADQMAKTFPYILTSDALKDMVKREMGIQKLPSITAEVLADTNIFTLSVRDPDPQLAYGVLNSFIAHYRDVSELVVGPTVMKPLDESGLPTEPSNGVNYVGAVRNGILLGGGLWVLLVLLLAMTRSTVHNEEELKQVINLRCLGLLPAARGRGRGDNGRKTCPSICAPKDLGEFAESIRMMRMRVEREMRNQEVKVLMVSSATPGEGKTTVSINLAAALAMKGKNTLLVDCDLRNPSVAANLGLEKKEGLVELVEGKISREQAVCSTGTRGFSVVASGGPTGNAPELLSRKTVKEFLTWCRENYDCVILDTPPSSLLADASEIAETADAALLVVRQDYASKSQIIDGARLVSEGGLNMLGCVLNYSSRGALSDGSGSSAYGYGYGSHKSQRA